MSPPYNAACEVAMAVLSDILEESANSTETMLHGHRVVGSGYNKKLYANSGVFMAMIRRLWLIVVYMNGNK